MLRFYFSGAPNPTKVALFLEEAGVVYEAIPVDTRKGEQHKPEYLAINPNAKVPAIVDGDVIVFDSNAILLYLAEKNGKFLPPKSDKLRGELLSRSDRSPSCRQALKARTGHRSSRPT
jgi:GSH-dependent disulfide-bond oxidoreductase